MGEKATEQEQWEAILLHELAEAFNALSVDNVYQLFYDQVLAPALALLDLEGITPDSVTVKGNTTSHAVEIVGYFGQLGWNILIRPMTIDSSGYLDRFIRDMIAHNYLEHQAHIICGQLDAESLSFLEKAHYAHYVDWDFPPPPLLRHGLVATHEYLRGTFYVTDLGRRVLAYGAN